MVWYSIVIIWVFLARIQLTEPLKISKDSDLMKEVELLPSLFNGTINRNNFDKFYSTFETEDAYIRDLYMAGNDIRCKVKQGEGSEGTWYSVESVSTAYKQGIVTDTDNVFHDIMRQISGERRWMYYDKFRYNREIGDMGDVGAIGVQFRQLWNLSQQYIQDDPEKEPTRHVALFNVRDRKALFTLELEGAQWKSIGYFTFGTEKEKSTFREMWSRGVNRGKENVGLGDFIDSSVKQCVSLNEVIQKLCDISSQDATEIVKKYAEQLVKGEFLECEIDEAGPSGKPLEREIDEAGPSNT